MIFDDFVRIFGEFLVIFCDFLVIFGDFFMIFGDFLWFWWVNFPKWRNVTECRSIDFREKSLFFKTVKKSIKIHVWSYRKKLSDPDSTQKSYFKNLFSFCVNNFPRERLQGFLGRLRFPYISLHSKGKKQLKSKNEKLRVTRYFCPNSMS